MRVTKADLEQHLSLLNRMCPDHDFDGWMYGQPLLEPEEGAGGRSEGTEAAWRTQPSRTLSNNARQPIETAHYAVTMPVESRHTQRDWHIST